MVVTGGVDHPRHVVQYNVTDGSARRLPDLLTGRWDHGCTRLTDGLLVAGGGWTGSPGRSAEMYETSSDTWREVGQLNIARTGLAITVLGEKILAMGGAVGYGQYNSSVEQFSRETMTWNMTNELRQARAFHAVTNVPAALVRC